jgi:hypothetical protein
MHRTKTTSRLGLLAVTALTALSLLATGVDAGPGNGKGHGRGHGKHKNKGKHRVERVRHEKRWREPRRVAVVERRVHHVVRQPRYVTYRSPRVVVVRPTPYVRVGGRIGSVHIGAIFGPRRHYDRYEYGCNFCDSHFASYSSYDSHVHGCAYRPHGVTIQARAWDDGGYRDWEGRDECDRVGYRSEWDDDDRYVRGDDRYDDEGYYEDEGY